MCVRVVRVVRVGVFGKCCVQSVWASCVRWARLRRPEDISVFQERTDRLFCVSLQGVGNGVVVLMLVLVVIEGGVGNSGSSGDWPWTPSIVAEPRGLLGKRGPVGDGTQSHHSPLTVSP